MNRSEHKKEILNEIINHLGGQKKTADLLERKSGKTVRQQDISYWVNNCYDRWPPQHVRAMCEAINNKYSPHDIRPDVFLTEQAPTAQK